MGKCFAKSKYMNLSEPVLTFMPLEIMNAKEIQNQPTITVREFLQRALQEHYLFRGLNSRDTDFIISRMRFIVVPKDEIILKKGEAGNFFYILYSGSAEIKIDNISKMENNNIRKNYIMSS